MESNDEPRRRPLKRGKPMKRSELAPRAQPKRSRRSTGPTASVRETVMRRAGGRCERCGKALNGPHSVHHRQPRGMGGPSNPEVNNPSNLLVLCGTGTTGCHGWIESNREYATLRGFLVPRPLHPADTPVQLHDTRWVTLDPAGTYNPRLG